MMKYLKKLKLVQINEKCNREVKKAMEFSEDVKKMQNKLTSFVDELKDNIKNKQNELLPQNKFEETNQVLEDYPEQEENNEKRESSFWKRINPIEGPFYIIGSPFLSTIYVISGGLFGNQSGLEIFTEIPLETIGFLTIGILDTLTIGTFDKEEDVLNFFYFY